MSGDGAPEYTGSSALPSVTFRFSPHSQRATEIHWQSWGHSAFQEARRQDKPIFLLISSSWCQWCHLMDATTLSETSVITILNNDYIPVRVDGDFRPDVNQRYNQNGWPSVVLLTPEGEILWGGVYVPSQQMLYYLGHIRRYYSENRQEIAEQVEELRDHRFTQKLSQVLPGKGLRPMLSEERIALADLPSEAGKVLRGLFDDEFGGFKIHAHLKFPHPDALELLLLLGHSYQSDTVEMVCFSLDQMIEGGLWDKEAGGFFRYSASSDWSMPHTEKMLDENAALLQILLMTAQKTGDCRWYDLARKLLSYAHTTLWQAKGGYFAGSQSADEEYYEPGLYSRATRRAPSVDPVLYTSWNAHMIQAYLLAARELKEPALESMALQALDYLCTTMLHSDGSICHYSFGGKPELSGQLADQIWMTRALLDAYDLHKCKDYLDIAIQLMYFACEQLLDRQSGLFYDYPKNPHAEGYLAIREQPLIENALAAECLLRLALQSKRQNLRDTGLLVLSSCLDKYRRAGIQGATYACVVARAIEQKWL